MGEEKRYSRERATENASTGVGTSHSYGVLAITRKWFPAAVLLAGLVVTMCATYFASRTIQFRAHTQFDTATMRARAIIRTRLEVYKALLRGTSGFLAAERAVTKQQFQHYVDQLRIGENYPGIQGVGFAARTAAADKDQLIAAMHQMGDDHFRIWPEGERADSYPIVYLEPLDRRNQVAIGYDMSSDPVRREAMERARDTGDAAASSEVTLVQELEAPKQPGFLIYVPVYRGGDVPPTTAGRRDQLVGFAYSPFRASDLFVSIFGNENLEVEMEIYDGTNVDSGRLLFRTAQKAPSGFSFRHTFDQVTTFDVSGRTWTAHFLAQPEMEGGWIVLLLLIGGSFLSLAMFYLSRAEARAREAAEQAAARLKLSELALRESEERLRSYATELEQRVAERTANLAQSISSLEGVLYHVAHDLRAPLRGMASFTNILLEEYATRLDERGRDYAKRISSAAQRMDRLVQDLLAYGRLAHTAVPVSKINLETEVSTALDQFSGEIESCHAEVQVCSPLPPVKANAAVLNQILSNLLSNALKFVNPDTKPRTRVRAEELIAEKKSGVHPFDARNAGKFVRLWVEDNGIGIQPEYHERIFRMFERLHGVDAYPGTGIGLAIVRKAVERMGGNAGVESQPDEGSRFWVELPAA